MSRWCIITGHQRRKKNQNGNWENNYLFYSVREHTYIISSIFFIIFYSLQTDFNLDYLYFSFLKRTKEKRFIRHNWILPASSISIPITKYNYITTVAIIAVITIARTHTFIIRILGFDRCNHIDSWFHLYLVPFSQLTFISLTDSK